MAMTYYVQQHHPQQSYQTAPHAQNRFRKSVAAATAVTGMFYFSVDVSMYF